jgi:hypothetical protein
MRTAFLAALFSSIACGFVFLATDEPLMRAAVMLGAAGLTLLWLSHLTAYAARAGRAFARKATEAATIEPVLALSLARRRFLATFLRSFVFAALVSTFGSAPGRAQGCNCYTENDCYCPADFPQCVFNPTTGEAICCGPNAVGCAGPTQTWCCSPGSNCYGTEGQCY